MTSTKGLRRFVLVPVALLLCAACAAGTGRSREVESPDVTIRIVNNLNPPRALTVRLLSQTGQRTLLGSVSPNQTRSLRYDEAAYHGQYRLLAEGAARGDVTSNAFTLAPGAQVVWILQNNTIQVMDAR